jgi:hypothetical protein
VNLRNFFQSSLTQKCDKQSGKVFFKGPQLLQRLSCCGTTVQRLSCCKASQVQGTLKDGVYKRFTPGQSSSWISCTSTTPKLRPSSGTGSTLPSLTAISTKTLAACLAALTNCSAVSARSALIAEFRGSFVKAQVVRPTGTPCNKTDR